MRRKMVPGMYYVPPHISDPEKVLRMWKTVSQVSGDDTVWRCQHVIGGFQRDIVIVVLVRVTPERVRKLFRLAADAPLP